MIPPHQHVAELVLQSNLFAPPAQHTAAVALSSTVPRVAIGRIDSGSFPFSLSIPVQGSSMPENGSPPVDFEPDDDEQSQSAPHGEDASPAAKSGPHAAGSTGAQSGVSRPSSTSDVAERIRLREENKRLHLKIQAARAPAVAHQARAAKIRRERLSQSLHSGSAHVAPALPAAVLGSISVPNASAAAARQQRELPDAVGALAAPFVPSFPPPPAQVNLRDRWHKSMTSTQAARPGSRALWTFTRVTRSGPHAPWTRKN